jgi:two-component system, chemotaxis family, protein-glutamate methylesterase/glutaminase
MTGTRVLICDESPAYAAALRHVLEHDREITVVGVCGTAERTLAEVPRLSPDIVTMDLELAGEAGLRAIEQIMSSSPVPILVLSDHLERDSATVADALAAGALDAMRKREVDVEDPDGDGAATFCARVKLLAHAPVIRHPRARLGRGGSAPLRRRRRSAAAVIGVCASAGGPPALVSVLSELPSAFPIPVLVVQHIGAGFADSLVKFLDGELDLPVRFAADGERPGAGVWVAPPGRHLALGVSGHLELRDAPGAVAHRPSADVLLRSIAAANGPLAVAVVLTGMGADGAVGLAEVRRAGGLTIAQDEQSSAVYGMPRAAAASGAELILPLDQIGPRLRALELARARP